MSDPNFKVNMAGAVLPYRDGEVNHYVNQDAKKSGSFDASRTVVFINGMQNNREDHAQSAMALSLLQMCEVVGVYNKGGGAGLVGLGKDLAQCSADKWQFNGKVELPFPNLGVTLVAPTAKQAAELQRKKSGESLLKAVESVLGRNAATLAAFRLLRESEYRAVPVFAHSQGNLILSNALQAIAVVDGESAVKGRVVHTFGSPTVNWPSGIVKFEHAFTFDIVALLSGFDWSFSVSKVGWFASGEMTPFTHGFLYYLREDPAFVVNSFRVGGWGVTLSMDVEGLADCLVQMGTNMERIRGVFAYLQKNHGWTSDEIATQYLQRVKAARNSGVIVQALKSDSKLLLILRDVLDDDSYFAAERAAHAFVKSLMATE